MRLPRFTITVEGAGRIFAVTIAGLMAGLFLFLLWALFLRR